MLRMLTCAAIACFLVSASPAKAQDREGYPPPCPNETVQAPCRVLAAGLGSPFDYATGEDWSRTIVRYEARVRGDLARLAAGHRIDTSRVVVAGFSLGGDLAWALAVRDPARIHGAVVMGSRAGYRGRAADHAALGPRGSRFFFALGAREGEARLAGARAAVRFLDQLGVGNRYAEFPEGQHEPAPVAMLAEALGFVFGDR